MNTPKFWCEACQVRFGRILGGVDSTKIEWISDGADSTEHVRISARFDSVKCDRIRLIFSMGLRGQVRQPLGQHRLEKFWLGST